MSGPNPAARNPKAWSDRMNVAFIALGWNCGGRKAVMGRRDAITHKRMAVNLLA